MRILPAFSSGTMLLLSIAANAQSDIPDIIHDMNLDVKEGVEVTLAMSLDIKLLEIGSNAELRIRPIIGSKDRANSDSEEFKSVVIAGRNRYMRYDRGYEILPEGASIYRAGSGNEISYISRLPYADWMSHSEVKFVAERKGCCGSPKSICETSIAEVTLAPSSFTAPEFAIKAEVDAGPKIQKLKGSAFVDFRVNKTDIDAGYRNNVQELTKILNTIESVRDNKDASIKEIWVKGYASPEGSYANNERLASGRTEALKKYVIEQSGLPDLIFHSSYEPEDWDGLRKYVQDSLTVNRDDILKIIDSELKPDAKDAELKRKFPAQYDILLRDVYPALRHTDYVVGYEIRQYKGIDDIRKAFAYRPSNLSENELLMLLADSDPGSVEFKMILQKGREMFDKNATLLYLDGIEEAKEGNFDKAVPLLEKAEKGGIPEASMALESIAAMSRTKTGVRYLISDT